MSGNPELPGFLGQLAPLLDHYGYLAIAVVVGLEGFGVPLPGQTILVVAAVYAGAGKLNIVAVALIGIVAATMGDNIGYLIGRAGGRRLLMRFGRYLFITPERLEKGEEFFERHGGKVVAVARFFDGLRQVNGIIAGSVGMPWPKFLLFNAVGATLWVGLWTGLGYVAGTHIVTVYEEVHRYQRYILGLAALVVIALIIRHVLARRKRTGQESTQE
jgi:membrane protein DedA with SNARE-associated domain